MKKIRERGFTLVELLIVIALIAILSVAVLATINPIEQANKAKDSTTQNDAAEVMNAYERYYANAQSYPWMDVDGAATVASVNTIWVGRSDMVGAALCNTAEGEAGTDVAPSVQCDSSTARGLLISTDELKDSFLRKGYTSLSSADPNYNANGLNLLWVDKRGSTEGNAVYVCYIPKAKSNRSSTNTLYIPTVDGSGNVTAFAPATPTQIAAATYVDVANSLFKCVP